MGIIPRFALLFLCIAAIGAVPGSNELRFCLRADPKTFDPLKADEDPSEAVRYLTAGELIRFNRQTQKLEPQLATSWTVGAKGRRIDFVLRQGVRFSDGTPFSSADVVSTIRRVADRQLHSAVADAFRAGTTEIQAQANGPYAVSVIFTPAVAGIELLFDQLAISSATSTKIGTPVLGPFVVTEHKSGQYILLRRNQHYWKTDGGGRKLPYVDTIRLDIQANRDTEFLRFARGELSFVDKLDAEGFDRLRKSNAAAAINAGPSLDSEVLWFNQTATNYLPAYKQRWFQSQSFRHAVSAAINRSDLVRLAYRGYAHPAGGPVSPTNNLWFNKAIHAQNYDPALALELLRKDGFHFDGHTLQDREGHAVEFSLITNAGSRTRAQLGAMLQQDLAKVGIKVSFTPIEFQSLIERITRTMQYEGCLLGLTNVELDPNTQMNVWPSHGAMHAWNPQQKAPATAWEAELDRLMKAQAEEPDKARRKRSFDRVQEIVAEQIPMVYLVHPDVLLAVSPKVQNALPSALPPHVIWNVESLYVGGAGRGNH